MPDFCGNLQMHVNPKLAIDSLPCLTTYRRRPMLSTYLHPTSSRFYTLNNVYNAMLCFFQIMVTS